MYPAVWIFIAVSCIKDTLLLGYISLIKLYLFYRLLGLVLLLSEIGRQGCSSRRTVYESVPVT